MSDLSIVEVTQADRDAAAKLVRWQRDATADWSAQNGEEAWQFFVGDFSRAIVQGIWDEHPVVQAFARHRASEADALHKQALLRLAAQSI